jgi:peptidoglycan-N-acetylglucosamine deacetylase
MRITPATIWSLTLLVTGFLWILFPAVRFPIAGIFIIHGAVLAWGIVDIRSQFFGKVYIRNNKKPHALALTFDDGPDPAVTREVIDLLNGYGFRATFFVVGLRARRHPELVGSAFAGGHTIACHDLSHNTLGNFRLRGQLTSDILETQDAIQKCIGKRPLLYRPPVGLMNPHVLPALKSLGMHCVGWSRRVKDWGNRRRSAFPAIAKMAKGGEVVLLHDTMPNIDNKEMFLQQLKLLFEEIRRKKITPLTIEDFFGLQAYE